MSRRQEFIARVRYQNALPPPPFAPKLVNQKLDVSHLVNSGSLSSMVLRREVLVHDESDLGMPLDLTQAPNAFDTDTPVSESAPAELDPEDQQLLVDVSTTRQSLSGNTSVSFLRKTEYVPTDPTKNVKNAPRIDAKYFDRDAQLQRVEETFELVRQPLDKIKHPKRQDVHAVREWPLFPDLKQFDLGLFSLRMMGSASLQHKGKLSEAQLATAIFCGNEGDHAVATEEDWIEVFVPERDEQAKELLERLQDTRDTLPHEEAEKELATHYKFVKIQDYSAEMGEHKDQFEEVLISLEENNAYYVPITDRVKLKRRRVNQAHQQLLQQYEMDEVDFSLREVTAEESIERDAKRSQYDPVTYGKQDEE